MQIHDLTKPNTVANFPMQANGAEMLRLACCRAVERGLKVIAPVHDAILLEAAEADIVEHVQALRQIMATASSIVLRGVLVLRTDATITRWPGRYEDDRGRAMWATVNRLTTELQGRALTG
jgi:hypothetical protein